MARSTHFGLRTVGLPTIGGALTLVALLATSAPVHAQYAVPPVDDGQAYFMATNGFNALVGPDRETGVFGALDKLAAEAQLVGHRNIGVQLITASTPMDHWSQGGGDPSANLARAAVSSGEVDVLALSAGAELPDPGIERFADLMAQSNPTARVLVQSPWLPWDGNDEGSFSNEDRDLVDAETIQEWIDDLHAREGYLVRMREQLSGINERLSSDLAWLVPTADAVYRLRQEVRLGRIPGLDRQSELFVDDMGNPATPVVNLVSYLWFTVMYRQPASGLEALIDPNDPSSPERERLLQQIAWEVAAAEPMSAVTAPVLWPEGARSMHDLLHDMNATEGGMEHMDQ